MKLDIPFELGQKVWVWKNKPSYYTKEVFDGYDHLGGRSHLETFWEDNYKACSVNFHFGLLDDYKIEEIFTSKYECEMKQQSAF